ncbi:hypothetical protein GCM10010156_26840 [Planobispora rosea]|uniref:Uncharacterized protein n=1 Tax=Planobispora rosea TaxID=35762 RepID=A0A8J3RXU1_PLARO|nr:hypothetical protein GCM10010156_26840 [Planobispora rosea]GIH85046.1 hypothetical protein Pro02_34540 [Planobispora rosea]
MSLAAYLVEAAYQHRPASGVSKPRKRMRTPGPFLVSRAMIVSPSTMRRTIAFRTPFGSPCGAAAAAGAGETVRTVPVARAVPVSRNARRVPLTENLSLAEREDGRRGREIAGQHPFRGNRASFPRQPERNGKFHPGW